MGIYGFTSTSGTGMILDAAKQPCIICNGYFDLSGSAPNVKAVSVYKSTDRDYYICVHPTCYDALDDENKKLIRTVGLLSVHLDAVACENLRKVEFVN